MNIDNINTVIEMIKTEELARFDMTGYIDKDVSHPCGTAACIAGFAAIAAGVDINNMISDNVHSIATNVHSIARDYLGLSVGVANNLFLVNGGWLESGLKNFMFMSDIKAEDAVAVLENLKITNEVNWTVCPNYEVSHFYT